MQRIVNGFLVIDKPVDTTSAQIVARVKRLTGAKKVGHTGTLDPFATGVLICCLNQATRLAGYLLKDIKRYRAVLHLGVETDTQDSTGAVISRSKFDVTNLKPEVVTTAFRAFEGTFQQQPPVYSALKHQGVPLYKLARMGKPVQKAPREVTVSRLVIKKIDLPEVTFEATCSAGTYIRTLGADIGRQLGCGGHLTDLRRLASGPFGLDAALSLDQLQAAVSENRLAPHLIPAAQALENWPRFVADKRLLAKVGHGQPVTLEDVGPMEPMPREAGEPILVMSADDRLMAVLGFQPDTEKLSYHCVFTDEINASGIV
jgi:tRNA pseudouridine55 synthase